MRRVVLISLAAGILAAGCGGATIVSPAPETVIGTLPAETTAQLPPGDPAAGKAVFASAGCTGCHTLAAAGSNGNVGPNLDQVKPPFSRVVDRVANGKGVMPSFKSQLSPQQIADVAAYVVTSTGGTVPAAAGGGTSVGAATTAATTAATAPPTTTEQPATTSGGSAAGGDATAGKALFSSQGCSACHTLADAGSTGTVGPNLDKQLASDASASGKTPTAFVQESIVNPNADIAKGFAADIMPSNFGSALSAKQIDDLVAYVLAATKG